MNNWALFWEDWGRSRDRHKGSKDQKRRTQCRGKSLSAQTSILESGLGPWYYLLGQSWASSPTVWRKFYWNTGTPTCSGMSMATVAVAVTEPIQLTKPEIFTLSSFRDKVCEPLFSTKATWCEKTAFNNFHWLSIEDQWQGLQKGLFPLSNRKHIHF